MKHLTYCLSKVHQLSFFVQIFSRRAMPDYSKRLNMRKFQRRRMSAGFTLVEILFAGIIGLVLMRMTMILYVKVNNSMLVGMTLAEINSDARLSMDRIVRDVRWATQLEANRSIDGENYTTGDNELIIKIPSIDTNGKFIPNTFDYVVYALDTADPTQLRKIVDPDGASSRNSLNQIIANNLNTFSLSSEGTDLSSAVIGDVTSVGVSINVNKTPLQNKTVSETIASNVALRNH